MHSRPCNYFETATGGGKIPALVILARVVRSACTATLTRRAYLQQDFLYTYTCVNSDKLATADATQCSSTSSYVSAPAMVRQYISAWLYNVA
jgi:hypothetical protein